MNKTSANKEWPAHQTPVPASFSKASDSEKGLTNKPHGPIKISVASLLSQKEGLAPSTVFHVGETTIEKSTQLTKKVEMVLNILKRFFPVDEDRIFFTELEGDIVGESTKNGILIDAVMLLHPANRLAHTLAHELAHEQADTDNEGLVEAYVRGIGFVEDGAEGGLVLTDAYYDSLGAMDFFLHKVSAGRELAEVSTKIFDLYCAEQYDEIFGIYENVYLKNLSQMERVAAEKTFRAAFPEFKMDNYLDGSSDLSQKHLASIQSLSEKTRAAVGKVARS